jgi:hypothetical protein
MTPHDDCEFNVARKGQLLQMRSNIFCESQQGLAENHGVGSSILPLGTT